MASKSDGPTDNIDSIGADGSRTHSDATVNVFASASSKGKEKQEKHANANPSEVDKFSSFASHWWDSRSNPLVGMNPIRVKFIREVLGQQTSDYTPSQLPLENKRVLDIGCGGGLLTESLSRLGSSLVVGLDASSAVVEVAKRHSFHSSSRLALDEFGKRSTRSKNGNIRYVGGMTVEEFSSNWISRVEQSSSPTEQPSSHELFDVITALEVVEHVPDPISLLRASRSLLKPGGILFVSTINRTLKSYGMAIVAAEYILGKVPAGTHDWNHFLGPEEVERMVCGGTGVENHVSQEPQTFRQIGLSGMVLKPPFVTMEWYLNHSDLDVNWIGAYQKQA